MGRGKVRAGASPQGGQGSCRALRRGSIPKSLDRQGSAGASPSPSVKIAPQAVVRAIPIGDWGPVSLEPIGASIAGVSRRAGCVGRGGKGLLVNDSRIIDDRSLLESAGASRVEPWPILARIPLIVVRRDGATAERTLDARIAADDALNSDAEALTLVRESATEGLATLEDVPRGRAVFDAEYRRRRSFVDAAHAAPQPDLSALDSFDSPVNRVAPREAEVAASSSQRYPRLAAESPTLSEHVVNVHGAIAEHAALIALIAILLSGCLMGWLAMLHRPAAAAATSPEKSSPQWSIEATGSSVTPPIEPHYPIFESSPGDVPDDVDDADIAEASRAADSTAGEASGIAPYPVTPFAAIPRVAKAPSASANR